MEDHNNFFSQKKNTYWGFRPSRNEIGIIHLSNRTPIGWGLWLMGKKAQNERWKKESCGAHSKALSSDTEMTLHRTSHVWFIPCFLHPHALLITVWNFKELMWTCPRWLNTKFSSDHSLINTSVLNMFVYKTKSDHIHD